MPRMQTATDHFTQRYERILTALFTAVTAQTHVLARWLEPVYTKLVLRFHCRALNLLGKLAAGLYRRPSVRTAPRPARAKPAAKPIISLPTLWKWLTRALPSPAWEAAQQAARDLQALMAEPQTHALFETAPALRTHLRPVCRALGVTLPGEPAPPEAASPEPPPAAPEPRPPPELGWRVHGRDGAPDRHIPADPYWDLVNSNRIRTNPLRFI
jgi:hypothetical protein